MSLNLFLIYPISLSSQYFNNQCFLLDLAITEDNHSDSSTTCCYRRSKYVPIVNTRNTTVTWLFYTIALLLRGCSTPWHCCYVVVLQRGSTVTWTMSEEEDEPKQSDDTTSLIFLSQRRGEKTRVTNNEEQLQGTWYFPRRMLNSRTCLLFGEARHQSLRTLESSSSFT